MQEVLLGGGHRRGQFGCFKMLSMWQPSCPLLGGLDPYLAAVNYEGETESRVSSTSSPPGMEAELGDWVQ